MPDVNPSSGSLSLDIEAKSHDKCDFKEVEAVEVKQQNPA
jgi:hypothetical protein